MPKLLLVEDEISLQITIRDRLVQDGYEVDTVSDGNAGLEAALSGNYDGVILDWMLPGIDGITVCRKIREAKMDIPIIMATARGDVVDTVIGLKLGADDYLAKPFDLRVLSARIEALLRRTPVRSETDLPEFRTYRFGPFVLDEKTRQLTKGGEVVSLFAQEYRLLVFFLRHPGTVLSRELLLEKVWEFSAEFTTRTVDVHVAGLRQKLGDLGRNHKYIKTVWKQGYQFIIDKG